MNQCAILAQTDARGRITFVNDKFVEISGYTREELLGQDHRIVNSDYHPNTFFRDMWDTIQSGKPWRGEIRNRAKNGSIYWVDTVIQPILDDDGRPVGYWSVRFDITEKKQLQEELSTSEEQFRFIFRQTHQPLCLLDRESMRPFLFNRSAHESLGYTKEEFVKQRLMHESDFGDDKAMHRRLMELRADDSLAFRSRFLCRNGAMQNVDVWASLVSMRAQQSVLMTWENIDEKVATASAKKRLEEAERIANFGHWHWDILTNEIQWSDQVYRIFGANPQSFHPTYEAFLDMVHPGDMDRVKRAIDAALTCGAAYEIDHRIVLGDGSERVVHERGAISLGDLGRPVSLLGTVHDVTEARATNARLRESENRYRTLIDSAPACIHEQDPEGKILSMNRAGLSMLETGDESQVIGCDYLSFVSEGDRQRIAKLLERASQGEPCQFEFSPAGSPNRQFASKFVPINGSAEGKPRIMGITQDITAQKLAESEIRRRKAFINAVVDKAGTLVLVLDRQGCIRQFNKAAEKLSGYSFEELAGKTPWGTVLPPELSHKIRAEAFEELVATGTPTTVVTYTNEWVTKSGERRLLEWHNTLLRDSNDQMEFMESVAMDVTDRERAQRALQESEQRLRNILDSMFTFVGLFSLDGKVLEANRAPLEAAALHRDEIIGKDFAETYWWSYSTQVQQDLRDALRRAGQGETVRYDAPVRVKGGQIITIDVTFSPLRDDKGRVYQIIGSAVDITDRKRMETELRESEERFRAVFEQSRDPICVVDSQTLRPIFFNRAVLEFLGYAADEFGKLKVSDIDVLEDDAAVAERIQRLVAEGSTIFETKMRSKQNRLYDVEVRASMVTLRDQPVIQSVWVDVSERKKNEELRQLREMELAHVGRLLTLGEMAGMISHQLHQPLTTIANYAQTVKCSLDEQVGEHTRELLDRIVSSSVKAGGLLRRIREFVQRRGLRQTTIDLNEVVRIAIQLCEARSKSSGVEVATVIGEESAVAWADPVQMEQVIINLLINAVEAVHDLDEARRVIEISVHQKADGSSEVTVRDGGDGVPAESRTRIFDSFYTTKEDGVGMGLPVARAIMAQHGGSLELDEEIEDGACFRISLPPETSRDN